jgi:hypothetical protein
MASPPHIVYGGQALRLSDGPCLDRGYGISVRGGSGWACRVWIATADAAGPSGMVGLRARSRGPAARTVLRLDDAVAALRTHGHGPPGSRRMPATVSDARTRGRRPADARAGRRRQARRAGDRRAGNFTGRHWVYGTSPVDDGVQLSHGIDLAAVDARTAVLLLPPQLIQPAPNLVIERVYESRRVSRILSSAAGRDSVFLHAHTCCDGKSSRHRHRTG